jgi:diacylglycerol kinase (ATP)
MIHDDTSACATDPAATIGPLRTKEQHTAAIRLRRRAVLVVNTRSRRGRRSHVEASQLLNAAGFTLLANIGVTDPTRLSAGLHAAVALTPDLLIAGGGDGTISFAARHLAHRDIALGLLPIGTTNNFARTLRVPLDLPAAVRVLSTGKVADVDLGTVGGIPFANLASVGLSAEVAGRVPDRLKRLVGRAAYPLTALTLLPRHRAFTARVTTPDGYEQTVRTRQLNIANGAFHAGTRITGDASAADGYLLAYTLGGHARRRLLAATVRHVATGRRRTLKETQFLATNQLRLETDPVLPIDVDGELCARTPVDICVDPKALRVMVAENFPGWRPWTHREAATRHPPHGP